MEFALNIVDNQNPIFAIAASSARDDADMRDDIIAMLGLKARMRPSDQLMAFIENALIEIVRSIENTLLDVRSETKEYPQTWPILVRSGLITDPKLIDFMRARFAEYRLSLALAKNGQRADQGHMIHSLLEDSDPEIAETAKHLLGAENYIANGIVAISSLRAEQAHMLIWHVVAALITLEAMPSKELQARAKDYLLRHDERENGEFLARKLLNLLSDDPLSDINYIDKTGVNLFFTSIATTLDMEKDHLLRLADNVSILPLAIILAAAQFPKESALEIVCNLKSFDFKPAEIALLETEYDNIDAQDARRQLKNWSVAASGNSNDAQ